MKKNGRVAVVTGGNRGIGLAIGQQLAVEGFVVVLGSRDEAAGQAAAAELAAKGLLVEAHALDVTSDESVGRLAADLQARHGGLDVLENNAGVAMDGFDAEVARRTLDTNFFGVMRVTDRLLPLMRAGGRVVMLSSGLGDTTDLPDRLRSRLHAPDLGREELADLMRGFVSAVASGTHADQGWPSSAYRVSKMGLNALTAIYARELGGDRRGILVNAACPGWVRTRMGGAGAPRSVEEGADTPAWLATIGEGAGTGKVFRDRKQVGW
jgi:carbonyl reductase 1